jgi:hypothetical protein
MTYTASIEDVVCASDLATLEACIEPDTVSDSHGTRADITTVWEACWAIWEEREPFERLELGALMAEMKAAHPWLPGKPSWAVVGDPEET